MAVEIKLESLSGEQSEGVIGTIHKTIGDNINSDEVLFDIESNKGNTAVTPKIKGTIKSLDLQVGDTVKIGDVLAVIEEAEVNEEKSVQVQNDIKEEKKESPTEKSVASTSQKQMLQSDITVIGGGPGGYVAAIQAAKLGAKVVLVEKEFLGGTCLNWGCIPTKALVRSSEVYNDLKSAEEYGLSAEGVSVDMKKVIQRKNSIVNQLVNGIKYLMDKNNITVVKGFGSLIDKETVLVQSEDQDIRIQSKHIIIATGSESSNLPIEGIELPNVITSKEALDLDTLPERLVIVGGGVIGIEFAFIYAALGVQVSVIEFLDSILAPCDEDVCNEISQIAEENGIQLYTSSRVESIAESEDDQCIVTFTKDNTTKYITADKVLMAVGRKPVYNGMNIEKLNLKINEKTRGIEVNEYMQTNIPNIYAIGDATNIIQLAHVASHQGIVAVKNILGKETKMSYTAVPSAIFTQPEIAMVGICEKAAKKEGIDVEIGKFPFAANGKALTLGESKGFVKIIKEKASGKVIGGTIIGPHATDLIAEITLAINNELTVEQIAETIHAHPTTAESIHEAVLASEGGALHFAE